MKSYLNLQTFFLVIIGLFFIPSCNKINGYTITGNIKNAENTKVYLEDIKDAKAIIIDTASIYNGKFKLSNFTEAGIYRLRIGDDITKSIFVYLDKKDKLTINADFKSLQNYSISGNQASISLKKLIQQSNANFAIIDTAYSKSKNANAKMADSLNTIFKNAKSTQVQFIKEFITAEKNDEVAAFALNLLGPMMDEEIPYLLDITEKLHLSSPKSKQINSWYTQMQEYKSNLLKESESGIAINTKAPNISLQNPNGDTIELKNLLGKYVLLDFWASWCQPCRMENPNVVRLYEKYHFQGLEIFSVSLDDKKERWINAIKQDDLSWENHGCDFAGWKSIPAQLYKIESIPATFLIDKKGTIIAKNLRGDALEQKLAELFATASK
jgi:thiol-disulfide isomerase/thioredoxin